MTASTEGETATGIATMTVTAKTTTEVSRSAALFERATPRSTFSPNLTFPTFLNKGFDSRGGGGGGRRAFGSGFRRDYDDSRGSGDRYGDRDRDRFGDRDRYGDHDRYGDREERREERGEC